MAGNRTAARSPDVYQYLFSATELARSGRYADAEQLALEVASSDSPFVPSALDLLARIYAQQGRYLEAESCWQRALSLAPGNPRYRNGLDGILREREHLPSLKFVKKVFLTALTAGLILALGYSVWDNVDRRFDNREQRLVETTDDLRK
jgi:tetratricopeptide (TPR) repeat protein